MPTSYRITSWLTAVICQETRERLQTLNPGSIVILTSATDAAGMIEATCDGERVRIFARDLAERSEPIPAEAAKVVARLR